jgi:hypothetical protein
MLLKLLSALPLLVHSIFTMYKVPTHLVAFQFWIWNHLLCSSRTIIPIALTTQNKKTNKFKLVECEHYRAHPLACSWLSNYLIQMCDLIIIIITIIINHSYCTKDTSSKCLCALMHTNKNFKYMCTWVSCHKY